MSLYKPAVSVKILIPRNASKENVKALQEACSAVLDMHEHQEYEGEWEYGHRRKCYRYTLNVEFEMEAE